MDYKAKRYSKYHSRRTVVDGITFDSKKEADYYKKLNLLEKSGKIKNLKLQPKYELIPAYEIGGKKIRATYYIADFEYEENGKIHIIDVKGYKTDVYKLKKKLFEYKYKIKITEI